MARLGLSNADHGEGKAWTAIAIGLFVAFGGVLFGYVHSLYRQMLCPRYASYS